MKGSKRRDWPSARITPSETRGDWRSARHNVGLSCCVEWMGLKEKSTPAAMIKLMGKLYKFCAQDRDRWTYAVSVDRGGKNLPQGVSPWRAIGCVGSGAEEGPRLATSYQELLAAVARDGYAFAPIKPSDSSESLGDPFPSSPLATATGDTECLNTDT
jgi:hypothetical protein